MHPYFITAIYVHDHKSSDFLCQSRLNQLHLTIKAPIMTAADDKFGNFFPNFQKKQGMI